LIPIGKIDLLIKKHIQDQLYKLHRKTIDYKPISVN